MSTTESAMESGKIKFMNFTRGFCFIKPDWEGPDVFCHVTSLKASGVNPEDIDPDGGQRVAYRIRQEKKGPSAVNIRLLKDGEQV
jgi:CspA family cold shock protein